MGAQGECIRYRALDEQRNALKTHSRKLQGHIKDLVDGGEVAYIVDFVQDTLNIHLKRLKKMERQMRMIGRESETLDIEAAKCYPIGELVEVNRAGFALCPWHEDRTPNLKVYGKRVHCFACGEGGDVIDLYMRLHGVSWKTAVKQLGG